MLKAWLSSLKPGAQATLNLVIGSKTLVGKLFGFWAQIGAVRSWIHSTIGRHKGEAFVLCGGWVQAVPQLCILYPVICLTTEEKSWQKQREGIRKVFGWSVPSMIRLANLAMQRWPRLACRPLPLLAFALANEGSSSQLTLSRSSQLRLWCGRKNWNTPILMNMPTTNVPGGTWGKAKTLGC